MMKRLVAALSLGVALAPRPVSAMEIPGVHGALEGRGELRIVMGRGHARLFLRHVVKNPGAKADLSSSSLAVFDGAVVVGARVLGPTVLSAELLDANAAVTRFEKLTAPGEGTSKVASLVSWGGPGAVNVQLFPVPARGERVIELEALVSTDYAQGRERLTLPEVGPDVPVLVGAAAEHAGDATVIVREGAASVLTLVRGAPPILAGELAVVPTAERTALRLRVATAPRLGELPEDARVVVLIDASKSMGDGTDAAREIAAESVSWLRSGRVAVVSFDREVRDVTPGMVEPADAVRTLRARPLALRHGSRIDRALARAKELLAGAPAGSPKRILLFTDLLTASELNEEAASRALDGAGLLHVIEPSTFTRASLARREDQAWEGLARKTGGLLWGASTGKSEEGKPSGLHAVVEELIRPKRLFEVKLAVSNAKIDASLPEELLEGESALIADMVTGMPTGAGVSGLLWGKRVGVTLSSDERSARRWAALATSELSGTLTDAETRSLALRGRAVTSLTSLLIAEDGAGPSRDGVPGGIFGLGLRGVSGGSRDGFGGIGTGRRAHFDMTRLRTEAALRYRACRGRGGARATLETTLAEIVDVRLVPGADDPAGVDGCFVESMFQADLGDFRGPSHRTTVVDLPTE